MVRITEREANVILSAMPCCLGFKHVSYIGNSVFSHQVIYMSDAFGL